jgi:hypothetical protein
VIFLISSILGPAPHSSPPSKSFPQLSLSSNIAGVALKCNPSYHSTKPFGSAQFIRCRVDSTRILGQRMMNATRKMKNNYFPIHSLPCMFDFKMSLYHLEPLSMNRPMCFEGPQALSTITATHKSV